MSDQVLGLILGAAMLLAAFGVWYWVDAVRYRREIRRLVAQWDSFCARLEAERKERERFLRELEGHEE